MRLRSGAFGPEVWYTWQALYSALFCRLAILAGAGLEAGRAIHDSLLAMVYWDIDPGIEKEIWH